MKNQASRIKSLLEKKIISLDQAKKYLESLKYESRCENIFEWAKYYFPEKFQSPFCTFHEYLISIRKETRTSTLGPRSHAKTTMQCFLIPIYQSLNEPNKFNHYLNIQSTATKAMSINNTLKIEFETNELLKRDYGNQTNDEKWTEKQFVLKNGVVFTSIGTGDSVRGLNYRNKRPDYVILDDIYDESDIYSQEAIKKKNEWFWGAIYKAISNKKESCIHIQGTAIHKTDLLHTLPSNIWLKRTFKSIIDNEKKIVLWPNVENYEKLMTDKEQMGSIIFSREMQNELRDEETAIIKLYWLKYYRELPTVIRWTWSWDTAIKAGDENDYSVGLLWAECENGYYLVDMFRGKIEWPELERQVKICFQKQPSSEILVEDKASGQQILQAYKRIGTMPFIAMMPGKNMPLSKDQRLSLVSPLFEAGKVFLPEDKPWVGDVVDELTNFPNAIHDDIVDSSSQYLNRRLNDKDGLWYAI